MPYKSVDNIRLIPQEWKPAGNCKKSTIQGDDGRTYSVIGKYSKDYSPAMRILRFGLGILAAFTLVMLCWKPKVVKHLIFRGGEQAHFVTPYVDPKATPEEPQGPSPEQILMMNNLIAEKKAEFNISDKINGRIDSAVQHNQEDDRKLEEEISKLKARSTQPEQSQALERAISKMRKRCEERKKERKLGVEEGIKMLQEGEQKVVNFVRGLYQLEPLETVYTPYDLSVLDTTPKQPDVAPKREPEKPQEPSQELVQRMNILIAEKKAERNTSDKIQKQINLTVKENQEDDRKLKDVISQLKASLSKPEQAQALEKEIDNLRKYWDQVKQIKKNALEQSIRTLQEEEQQIVNFVRALYGFKPLETVYTAYDLSVLDTAPKQEPLKNDTVSELKQAQTNLSEQLQKREEALKETTTRYEQEDANEKLELDTKIADLTARYGDKPAILAARIKSCQNDYNNNKERRANKLKEERELIDQLKRTI